MDKIIITGASKGLGRALALELAGPKSLLYLVARDIDGLHKIADLVKDRGGYAKVLKFDLTESDNIEELANMIFNGKEDNQYSLIAMINNAGTIEPIDNVGNFNIEQIRRNVNINFLSPIIFTNLFIKLTEKINCEKRIINITSGVTENPLPGWGLYSAAKAATKVFLRTVNIEQNSKENPVKVVSFDPGVIDTDMQSYIRSMSKDKFSQVDCFKHYYTKGMLQPPEAVAVVINKLYIENWLAKGTDEDIRDYKAKFVR